MSKNELVIALPWHSIGHGNLGIDALTRANIEILRAAARRAGCAVRFVTLCSPQVDPAIVDSDITIGPLPSIAAIVKGRSAFLKALRGSDLVVDIGEGDSWADIYGGRRFAFHAGTKIAALALRKPLVLAPQTIGPFKSRMRQRIANAIMSRCRAVFARDDLSYDYLKTHRIDTEIDEYIDVAFRLPFERRPRDGDGVRVGLNVSGLLYRGGYSGSNEFGLTIDYPELTHRLIETLHAKPGVEIHLVPHVVGRSGNDGDAAIMPELARRFPYLKVPPAFDSASQAKSYMSGLDFVVGGRMHACIGAFSAGVPVVPIAYSRKFNGLFGTLGYPHFVDGRSATTEAALETILTGFDRRDVLARDIETGLELAERRLDAYEQRMAAILTEIARAGS